MPDDSGEYCLRRRRWLKIVGTAGTVGIAGCGSGGNNTPGSTDSDGADSSSKTEGTDGTESGGKAIDPEFTYMFDGGNPRDLQFNPYNPSNYNTVQGQLYTPVAVQLYNERAGEYESVGFESWNFPDGLEEDSEITVTISSDLTWTNGDPVTARDFVTQIRLQKFFGDSIWNFIKEVKEDSEKTAKLVLSGKVNPNVIQGVLLRNRSLNTIHSVYKKYLSALQDAEGDEEAVKEAKSKLIDTQINDPITNGVFELTQRTDTAVVMEKRDGGHPAVDEVNFPTYALRKYQSRTSALKKDKLDAEEAGPKDLPYVPDSSQAEMRQYYEAFGEAMCFNLSHDIWGRQNVRRAIAYAVNRIQADMDWQPDSITDGSTLRDIAKREVMDQTNGLTNPASETWYDSDVLKRMRQPAVNYEANRKKAEKLLKEEGFTKPGKWWKTPNGKTWEPALVAASYWAPKGKSIVGQLKNFGIKAKLQSMEGSQFYGTTFPNKDYGFAMFVYGTGSAGIHPYFIYNNDFVGYMKGKSGQGIDVPETVEVPMPIGDPSGGDGTETLNLADAVTELGETEDKAKARELVMKLGWAYNRLLHIFPLRQYSSDHIYTHDAWNWPEKDSAFDHGGMHRQLTHVGKLTAKTE